jgi:hypothetical protein
MARLRRATKADRDALAPLLQPHIRDRAMVMKRYFNL